MINLKKEVINISQKHKLKSILWILKKKIKSVFRGSFIFGGLCHWYYCKFIDGDMDDYLIWCEGY